MTQEFTPSRRAVLVGAGALALTALGGCATYGQNSAAGPADTGSDEDPNASPEPSGTPKPLAQIADIPVGGGAVIDIKRVVVTQPTKGHFKCFTAVCTHQGCLVGDVANGTINCPCHGSRFDIADGSVANGPATRALRSIDIVVNGTDITLA